MCNQLPTNQVLYRRKHHQTGLCPYCENEPETFIHMMCCTEDKPTDTWDANINNLRNWLTSQDTDPILTQLIIERLELWRLNPSSNTIPREPLYAPLDILVTDPRFISSKSLIF